MKLSGARILYVTADPEAVRSQLAGAPLQRGFAAPLADAVSTDEMTPAWACYYYDERLGRYCLVGFRGGAVSPGAVQEGGFSVLVGGESFGCGSSRETAPYAQRACGIRLVIARSFARIYRNNCHNLGIFTSTDLALAERLEAGETIALDALLGELDPLSRAVVSAGGLAHYRGVKLSAGTRTASPRPRTLAEKLLLAHCDREGAGDLVPGDALFVRADVRFSHDYTTAMVDAQFRAAFGESARVTHPESVFLFRDHLALLDRVMPSAHRRLGLLSQAEELASVQRAFAERQHIRLYDELPGGGSAGICHNVVIEQLALPGDVVVGTDSHTCMAGVLGCLAFGVGSTDMAAGLVTREFRVTVPETVRVEFLGALAPGTCAKDVWLSLFAREDVRGGLFRGRVIEFGGPGYYALPLDERATLTNMAAEGGAFTALAAPDSVVFEYIARERGLDREALEGRAVHPDADATYAARLSFDLGSVEPMLALPGDPYRTIALRELGTHGGAPVRVDIAYGGSCTGGKRVDMDLYARVLRAALSRSEKVAPGVSLFIQFGSEAIRRYATERGYVEVFRAAGATLLEPACGACIRSGPGTSEREDQVTVSAINRNFPGRSGPGQVYLASPLVVAASAVRGEIALPEWAR